MCKRVKWLNIVVEGSMTEHFGNGLKINFTFYTASKLIDDFCTVLYYDGIACEVILSEMTFAAEIDLRL